MGFLEYLLSCKMLANERDYWNFQLLNASFMIAYSYHSFVEVMFMAAATRRKNKGEHKISDKIMEYLKQLSEDESKVPPSNEIIGNIKDIITAGNETS